MALIKTIKIFQYN